MGKNSFDQNVLECMVIMNWRSPNESDCPDSRYPKILARWQKGKVESTCQVSPKCPRGRSSNVTALSAPLL